MADIEITGGPGFYTITPTSDAGREWIAENVHVEAWQTLGPGIGCDDGRLVAAIVDGAQAAGLEVE